MADARWLAAGYHNQHNIYVNSKIGMETTMLATGNQLKAARALAGVDQQQVADSAGVNVNTIRNMEGRGAEPITSSAVTVRKVQLALEALGIEFFNHSQPGVRLRKRHRARR
jgi:transcriptional regulator with XRE-family HTH domain